MVRDTATTDLLSGDVRLPLGSSEGLDNDGQGPKRAVDGQSKRTGTLFFGGLKDLGLRGIWSTCALITTSVVGSGMLSMGESMAQLGWVAGRRHAIVCFVVQYLNLLVVASKYTQEAAFRMTDLIRYACHHSRKRTCRVYRKPYNIVAGVIQIFFSQIPDFDQLGWLSSLSVVTFIIFSAIGVGLTIGRVTENGMVKGSAGGMSLGTDAIESPQSDGANKIMKKATKLSLVATTSVYLVFGGLGYAAFGEKFTYSIFYFLWNPYWLLDIASLAMLINSVGAYQIFSQPMFAMVEKFIGGAVTNCEFATKDIEIPIPCFSFKTNLLRLVCRSSFVITTTVMSMFLAFYNDSLQVLVDGVAFWFLGIYFPLEMYKKEKQKYRGKWLCAQIVIIGGLVLTIASIAAKIVVTFIRGSYDPLLPDYGDEASICEILCCCRSFFFFFFWFCCRFSFGMFVMDLAAVCEVLVL
ncbi:Amino acid permease 2 [Morella rubra]|uniref:Amino acid permease 2 n=1 Tax=Morella rubra TaxID=262757 RepID=A0A6A1UK30_9ROSI|nr:Amino acid permease 2 [Morella rubra]